MKTSYLNTIDYITILIFLLITLWIGLHLGKGIKSVRQYALADKKYGTFALTLTFLATILGANSTLEVCGLVFSKGFIILFAILGVLINFLIVAIFIAPKIVKFPNAISLGDLMEKFYGKNARIVSAILSILFSVCMVSTQLVVLGWVCHSLLSIDPIWSIPIGGVLIALYSSFGGIQSITSTNIFHFLLFVIVVPFIATIVIRHVGGYDSLFVTTQVLKNAYMVIFGHFFFGKIKNCTFFPTFR